MKLEDLQLLLEINKILITTLDLQKLLTIIVEQVAQVVQAEASLMLFDDRTNELFFDIALGEKGEKIKEVRLKMGEGVAGWVAEHGQSLIINDVEKDARWSPRGDEVTKYQTKSILCVPLKIKDKIIGVMEAINKIGDKGFDSYDQEVLEAYAAQASVAVENARLFKEVKEKKEQIESVFKGMSDGALMTDADYRVLMINDNCLRLLNLKAGEILGQNFLDLLSRNFSFPPPSRSNSTITNYEMKRKEGKNYFLENSTTRLMDEKNNTLGYIILLRDITEMKNENLLKQNFISFISHKLKTPLTGIIGYSAILMETQMADDFQKNALKAIAQQSQILDDLVSELITFAMIESEVMELNRVFIELSPFFEELTAYFKHNPESQTRQLVITPSCFELKTIFADAGKIKNVFKHLIENAFKFNKSEEKIVKILARRLDNGFAEFTVTDNGPGISPEEYDKIFQKFYQVEENFTGRVEGAGLGLSLVKKIVEQHGGTARVESKLNEGSSFIFTLPIDGKSE